MFHRAPEARHACARSSEGFSTNPLTALIARPPAAHRVARLDPAVLGLRLLGDGAGEDDPLGSALDELGHVAHMVDERPRRSDEVVRRKDRDGRFRIAMVNPDRRQENPGGGAEVVRLHEHHRQGRVDRLLREIARMALDAHHTRTSFGDGESHAVERLPQQRARADDARVLLGLRLTVDMAHQGPEARPLPTREHHPPEAGGVRPGGPGLPGGLRSRAVPWARRAARGAGGRRAAPTRAADATSARPTPVRKRIGVAGNRRRT